jgi:hypothetical protein
MASVYTNHLRLEEIGSGEQSGTWGDTTNTNLELIAEAFGYGTEAITTNQDTHTTTIANGASSEGRHMYLKYTGALDSDCTITLTNTAGDFTVSKVWIIENNTTDSGSSGPYNIILTSGSGDNITIPNGHRKVIYTDGAGSGGAVVDAFTNLNVPSLFIKNPGTGDDSTALLTLQTTESDIAADDVLGKISFQAPNEGTGTDANLIAAAIQAKSEGDFSSSSNATSLEFMTGASATATTRFAIASDGSLSTPTAGTSNVRFGVNAGNSIQSGGNYNVTIGDEAGTAITTSDNNTLVGYACGDAITTGNATAVGYLAGSAITTTVGHVLMGELAGTAITDGAHNTAFGSQALSTDTKGSKSVAVGHDALKNQNFTTATDTYNTAVGYDAGVAITTGLQNTLIGGLTGDALTDADYNVAVGQGALATDTLGSKTTAIGTFALANQNFTTATDSNNTAVGYNTGNALTTGINNVFMGFGAGDAQTTANQNVAIGKDSMTSNVAGAKNVAIGTAAMANFNTTAADTYNTCVGDHAGSSLTTGINNVFIGGQAGDGTDDGNYNTALGYGALGANCGSNNVAVGNLAGAACTTGGLTAVGDQAAEANTVAVGMTVIGNGAAHANTEGQLCLIAGSSAASSWNITSNANTFNTILGYNAGLDMTTTTDNVFVGAQAGQNVTTGGAHVIVGRDAANTLTTGGSCILIGYSTDVSASGASHQIAIGTDIAATGDNTFNFGKSSNVVTNTFTSDASFTRSSDVHKKTNIEDDTLGLDFINDLRTVTFNWRPNSEFPEHYKDYHPTVSKMQTDIKLHGMIAQDVKAALDKQGVDSFGGWSEEEDGSQRISQEMFVHPIIRAVQELSAQVDELKAEIKELKNG